MATAGTDNLKIEWTLQKGKADFYEVNISNADLFYSSSNKTIVTTVHFHDLYPGRVFLITVTAVAGNLSSTSNNFEFATSKLINFFKMVSDLPGSEIVFREGNKNLSIRELFSFPFYKRSVPTPPGSLNITQRITTSLHLRWETPTKMQDAPFISYRITYQRPGGKMQTTTTINNSMVLSQLSSGTEYNISVYTIGPQNLTSPAVQKSAYTCEYTTKICLYTFCIPIICF